MSRFTEAMSFVDVGEDDPVPNVVSVAQWIDPAIFTTRLGQGSQLEAQMREDVNRAAEREGITPDWSRAHWRLLVEVPEVDRGR